ncbi:interferon-gamma-inducible GTPase 10-like [Branchiostoma lanceolatum]|uniref:interferon-gamma-inducible GTPase 10-like n=1 Tax=Branchiostoma lanceolatum TaxID=7740 RepID=UPI003456A0E1
MGTSQSRQPQAGQERVFSNTENCVEIKRDDLGPDEQEVFRRFADNVRDVSDDQPPEEMLKMLQKEIGQYDQEETWMGQAYVRIGIVGVSGAGKSTFINSFRELRANEKEAADVGTTETTTEPNEYPHPEHDHVILVDFPGALFKLQSGSLQPTTFNTKEYARMFGDKMKECNVFLVFTSGRVHDNAVWIAKVAKEMGKKVLFVRSKFDRDVEDKQDDDPEYFAGGQEEGEERLLQFQREDYVTKLETIGYGRVDIGDVFVICGKLRHIQAGRWGAAALKEAILKQLDIQQKMLLMTTTTDYSPTMVKAKANIYKSHAWKVALGVAAGGVIPYAGTFVNAGTMLTTMLLFKRGFGLNEASVRKLATTTSKDARMLQRFVDDRLSILNGVIQFLQGEIDLQSLRQLMTAQASLHLYVTALTVDAAIDVAVPFVGGLVTAPFSFGLAWSALCLFIDKHEQCALDLHELAFR